MLSPVDDINSQFSHRIFRAIHKVFGAKHSPELHVVVFEDIVEKGENVDKSEPRYFFVLKNADLKKMSVEKFSDFQFVSWIMSNDFIFPNILHIQ